MVFGFDCGAWSSSLLSPRLVFFCGTSILGTRGINPSSASPSSSSSPTSGSRDRARDGVNTGGRDPRWEEGCGVGGLVRGVFVGLAGVSETSKSTLTPEDGSTYEHITPRINSIPTYVYTAKLQVSKEHE